MNKMPTSITTIVAAPNTLTTTPATTEEGGGGSSSSSSSSTASSGVVLHNGREARNLAEKQRRDKLNASIQELATMVPHVAESTRRLDKTSVLRFAAHGLRLQHVFGKTALKKQQLQQQQRMLYSTDSGVGRRLCGAVRGGGGGGTGSDSGCDDDYLDAHPHALLPTITQHPQLLTDTLMQLLDSFFITLTCHGQIVVISASVEQLLGHCQSDLYGQNILNITHPDDQNLLLQQLIPRDLESLFRHDNNNDDEDYPPHHLIATDDVEDLAEIDARLRADRRCFTLRLARAGTRSTEATRNYEIVKIDGCFRRSDYSATATGGGNYPIVSQLIRRSRNSGSAASGINASGGAAGGVWPNLLQHDAIAQAALHGVSGNDIVLVAMARIIHAPKLIINRLFDGSPLEYRTRHLIDGRIIDCDQRIGLVAGYMKEEVRNLSPFSFMHQDDVRWVIVALRQMYDCNSDYGESCYRLLSRNGHFIYLQTRGYLEIDKNTNKVHSFICVNTLLNGEEGRRKVQEMKNKFSVIIKTKIPTNSLQDVPASQNPQQLERIVLYLIENLQKRHEAHPLCTGAVDEGGGGGVGGGVTTAATSPLHAEHVRYARATTITPPLALVPPEAASVKNSISKSVSVVNVTAAKNLQNNSQHHSNSVKSPPSVQGSDVSLCSPASSVEQSSGGEESLENVIANNNNTSNICRPSAIIQRPSVLQMNPIQTTKRSEKTTSPMPSCTALLSPSSSAASSPNVTSASSSPNVKKCQQQQVAVLKRLYVTSDESNNSQPAKRSNNAIMMTTTTTICTLSPLQVAVATNTNTPSPSCLSSPTSTLSSFSTSPTSSSAAASSSPEGSLDQSFQHHTQKSQNITRQQKGKSTSPCSSSSSSISCIISPVPQFLEQNLDAICIEQQKQQQQRRPRSQHDIKTGYSFHIKEQQQLSPQQLQQSMHTQTITTTPPAATIATHDSTNIIQTVLVSPAHKGGAPAVILRRPQRPL